MLSSLEGAIIRATLMDLNQLIFNMILELFASSVGIDTDLKSIIL